MTLCRSMGFVSLIFGLFACSGEDILDDPCLIGTAGAPACYKIRSEACEMGNGDGCLVEFRTSDSCGVRDLDAELIFFGYDPERCSSQALDELPNNPCPTVADPVCAKEKTDIVCVTAPCADHQYATFGNACEATSHLALVSFSGACSRFDLEMKASPHHRPIKLDDNNAEPGDSLTIIASSIEGDQLKVRLSYSGCSEQVIDFHASTLFLESFPVQAETFFKKTVDSACLAVFESAFEYDLLPLKAAYQESYQMQSGEIVLRGLSLTYRF